MRPAAQDYQSLRQAFRWRVPERFNIGVGCSDRWADGSGRLAIVHVGDDGSRREVTFDQLAADSNRLANALAAQGVMRGDRVAVLLPQRPETAVAHLAAYKLGAIALPLFGLFGEEALAYRLADSGAAAIVTDAVGIAKLTPLRERLPDLRCLLSVDGPAPGVLAYDALLERASDRFRAVDTRADDPAVIIYTSGTTGQPKGALHAHRVLLGHLPGVEMPHHPFPRPGDRFWTPADWAWIGGLFDVLLPSLHHGVPVVAHRFGKFDPERAFALMADLEVRNAFLPPTALKLLRTVPDAGRRWAPGLRSIGSGGESLGTELLDWGRETFGVTINEFYGQTECNLVVASCAALMTPRPGAMGRPVPGHDVAVIDAEGQPCAAGVLGQIAVRRPDPVMFLGYWNKPEATAAKFHGDWLLTGDQGVCDEDGWLTYVGRDDDVITSGGYRIGPGEIEDCLLRHPAIALAAAVGVPDPVRTERVKAFVVLAAGYQGSDGLAREIQDFVRHRLAAHEYPREVAFVESLPMTTTGKIMRRVLRQQDIDSRTPGGLGS